PGARRQRLPGLGLEVAGRGPVLGVRRQLGGRAVVLGEAGADEPLLVLVLVVARLARVLERAALRTRPGLIELRHDRAGRLDQLPAVGLQLVLLALAVLLGDLPLRTGADLDQLAQQDAGVDLALLVGERVAGLAALPLTATDERARLLVHGEHHLAAVD